LLFLTKDDSSACELDNMVYYAISSPSTPYNNSFDKINSVVFFVYAVANAVINYFINVAWVTWEVFMQVLFGWVRTVLIAGFLVSLLSVAVADHHQSIITNANYLKCSNAGFFHTAEAFTGVLAEKTPPLICFWNFWISSGTIVTKSVLTYLWECSDFSNIFDDLKTLIAKFVESFVLFWFKSDNGTDYIPFLSNRYDFASVVTAAQDLIGNLKNPLICACSDFSPYSLYILSVVRDENIPTAISSFGNSIIGLVQTIINTVLNVFTINRNQVPDIGFINTFCDGTIASGLFIDASFTNFIRIFWPTFDPSRVGSVVAYTICTVTDLIYLFIDSTLNYIWIAAFNAESYNIFLDANLDPIVDHIDNLGICLVYTLTPLNICLAQTIGNFVRFISTIIGYSRDIVQKGENNLYRVKNSLNRFVGQSSYGGGGHILNSAGHDVARPQTSLTCLLSTATNFNGQYSTCSVKLADLANSIVNLLLTPLELISEILDNRALLQGIDGNPLASDTRDDFEQFFEIIFDVVLDEIFNPFDYFAHLVGCIPILADFSIALQTVVRNLRNIARELRTLIIKVIEFIVELIILIITILSGPIFDNSSETEEFGIFASILLDLFTQLLTLVLAFAKNIVDLTIGAPFSALFNQPTQYASDRTDRSSPATLTACFGDFGECICGIFYVNIGKNMCIPFTDICLADILPSCGIFQTTPTWSSTQRKREAGVSPYTTYFEYLANEFPNGNCGEVFRTFENYGKDDYGRLRSDFRGENGTLFYEKSVPSMQATAFLTCLDRLFKSFELAETYNWTIPVDYYIQDNRFLDSSSQVMRGTGMLFFDTFVQSVSIFDYPEYTAGLPTQDKPVLDTIYSHETNYKESKDYFKRNGVDDPEALDYLANMKSLFSATIAKSKNLFYEKSNSMRNKPKNPYVRFLEIGGELMSLTAASGFMVGREMFGVDVVPHLTNGFVSTLEKIQTTSLQDVFPPVKQTSHLQKRDHSLKLGGKWFPSVTPTPELNDLEDLVVEDYEIAFFKGKQLAMGTSALGRKVFGPYLELIERRDMTYERSERVTPLKIGSPRRDRTRFAQNQDEDILSPEGYYHYTEVKKRNLMPHIYALNLSLPDSLMGNEALNFHPDVSYLYGMNGMIDFQHHIPNSCSHIHAYCDNSAATGCDDDFYFQTLGLCSSIFSFGIVSQCGDDFQAIAIYSDDDCDGTPIRIAIATAANPIACIQFSIDPLGPINNFFCIRYDECQACPIRRLIPNLDCAIVDRIAHYDNWLLERCWVLLIGPIFPPFNFTDILPSVTEPLVVDPTGSYEPRPTPTPSATSTCSSVCGDRILSTEVDGDGRPCEECDDGNLRDGDGCNTRCKREICPQFRTPSAYPVPSGQEIPSSCSSGIFKDVWKYRTSRYCHERSIVNFPYTGNDLSTDVPFDSFQVSCVGRNPVVIEYQSPECNGYSVSRTIRKNCSQESSLAFQYYYENRPEGDILTPAMGVRLGADITCRSKCRLCGDGAKTGPEQCDSNPFSSTSCVYCIKTVPCNVGTDFCLGVCRPNFGDIPIDSRYGVQSPSNCATFAGAATDKPCPIGSTCHYYIAVPLSKKRELPFKNLTRLIEFNNFAEEFERTEREEEERLELAKRSVLVSENTPVPMNVRVSHTAFFELQASPVKDNWMYLKTKKLANDVVDLFTSSTADGTAANIVTWWSKPGIGPRSDPSTHGAAYELAFQFICDPILSFDGSLGFGILKGTLYWLYYILALVIVSSFMGILASNIGVTIVMFTGLAMWLRFTFGLALVGCYISSSANYFRVPEVTLVYTHDVAVFLNSTCIDFVQPLSRSPCNSLTCNQTFASCEDLNYIDGFDTIVAWIEVFMPDPVRIWFRTSNTVAKFESALKTLSSASGYELYSSYQVAKDNFNFNGVVPPGGYELCTGITSLSLAQIALFSLFAVYVIYVVWKVQYPALLDSGLVLYAAISMVNHLFIIPNTAAARDAQLKQRLKTINGKTKLEIKIQ
jgi:cysteine-rich repeat protein